MDRNDRLPLNPFFMGFSFFRDQTVTRLILKSNITRKPTPSVRKRHTYRICLILQFLVRLYPNQKKCKKMKHRASEYAERALL